jgi:hypothetical protein
MTQQQVQIAAGMYEARDTAKRLTTPERFKERISEFRHVIEEVMRQDKVTVLPATLSLLKQIHGDHFLKMWLVATAVEMIEPSNK